MWQSDSIIHPYILHYKLFHCGSSQVIEYSFLGPCLIILYKIVHICRPQISISSLPLAFTHLWVWYVSVFLLLNCRGSLHIQQPSVFEKESTLFPIFGVTLIESLCHQLIGGLVRFKFGCFDKNSKVARDEFLA